jgi:hypothetical protein
MSPILDALLGITLGAFASLAVVGYFVVQIKTDRVEYKVFSKETPLWIRLAWISFGAGIFVGLALNFVSFYTGKFSSSFVTFLPFLVVGFVIFQLLAESAIKKKRAAISARSNYN